MNDLDSIRRRDPLQHSDPIPPSTRPDTPAARTRQASHLDEVVVDFPLETPYRVADLANLRPDPSKAAQEKIETLRKDFAGPYTVDGKQVSAPVMFRMGLSNARAVASNAKDLAKACASCRPPVDPSWIRSGQASPAQVVAVTQALIQAGKLPSAPGDVANRIRTMQWRFGVGADCASFTRQAFERVTGRSMKSVGLNPYGEAFRGLDSNRHFEKVGIADIQAGDIVTLDPRNGETIGHNVIVEAHRVVDATERRGIEALYGDAAKNFFATNRGTIHAIVVASSWGAGDGDTKTGGERRELWLTDGKGHWGHVDAHDVFSAHDGGPAVFDSFHGAYRPRSR